MHALAPALLALSALIIFALGALHLMLTFHGNKLHPRDAQLEARLKEVTPILTSETTMWKAWSASMQAIPTARCFSARYMDTWRYSGAGSSFATGFCCL